LPEGVPCLYLYLVLYQVLQKREFNLSLQKPNAKLIS